MTTLIAKFNDLTKLNYAEQAKWWLNGFWKEGAEQEAENIWKYTHKFFDLDGKTGTELDEFNSHKFLESLGETLTVVALREKLKKIDLNADGRMALVEYLAFKYQKSMQSVVDAPQGDNTEEITEAQTKVEAAQNAFSEVQSQLEQQERDLEAQTIALAEQRTAKAAAETALDEQNKKSAEANRTLEAQQKAEEAVRKSEDELRVAVADLKKQEDEYHAKIKALTDEANYENAKSFNRSKAANLLAQLKQEDPMPLRRAKITQEAALRKVEKEIKAAESATAAALQAATDAEKARVAAELARQGAEDATKEAEAKTEALKLQKIKVEEAFKDADARLKEAMDFLEEAKKKGGVAYGAIWWLERELKEAQKYLPKRKQVN